MKKHLLLLAVLAGCVPLHHPTSITNSWSLGTEKSVMMEKYPALGRCPNAPGALCTGMEVRAARQLDSGSLIEVGTIRLTNPSDRNPVEYWLLFVDGRLKQWGRPEDWQSVAARYQVDFNPTPGVRSP